MREAAGEERWIYRKDEGYLKCFWESKKGKGVVLSLGESIKLGQEDKQKENVVTVHVSGYVTFWEKYRYNKFQHRKKGGQSRPQIILEQRSWKLWDCWG